MEEIWTPRDGVEVCVRENDREKFYFFLNHRQEDVEMTMEKSGCNLLEKRDYAAGEKAVLAGKGVMIYQVER